MKIDINFYRSAKADFIANLKRRNVEKWDVLNNELSLYCACFGLPVIVAIEFAAEEFPQFSEELEKKKVIVGEFYGYE
jgi:hypothetical protein